MDNKKLVEKVKKLLKLAGNNPSQEEANAAYAKAQELIAAHNLYIGSTEDEKEQIILAPATHSNNEGYRVRLAHIIGKNFRCKPIMNGLQVNFLGYETDVNVCVQVYNHAYKVSHNQAIRLKKEYKKNGLSIKGVANSYYHGFMHGIQKVLDAQCRALAIVVPDEVNKELKKISGGSLYKGRMHKQSLDFFAYSKGDKDGKNYMNSHCIN